jgi:hypothetical protein
VALRERVVVNGGGAEAEGGEGGTGLLDASRHAIQLVKVHAPFLAFCSGVASGWRSSRYLPLSLAQWAL